MARSRAHFEVARPEVDPVAVREVAVRALGAARLGDADPAADAMLEEPRAGDVIGMQVGVERELEVEAELVDQCRVAQRLVEDGVDQHRLAARGIGEQVRVGGGGRIAELAEGEAHAGIVPST